MVFEWIVYLMSYTDEILKHPVSLGPVGAFSPSATTLLHVPGQQSTTQLLGTPYICSLPTLLPLSEIIVPPSQTRHSVLACNGFIHHLQQRRQFVR